MSDTQITVNSKSSSNIADKFEREWLQSKPTAITGYSDVANTLAQKAINNKQKMITNFLTVMATSKYEDSLRKYVGNNLLADLYNQGVTAKTSFTDTQKQKFQRSLLDQRNVINVLQSYILFQDLFDLPNLVIPRYSGIPKRLNQEISVIANNFLHDFGNTRTSFTFILPKIHTFAIPKLNWKYRDNVASGQSDNNGNDYIIVKGHKIDIITESNTLNFQDTLDKYFSPEKIALYKVLGLLKS